jgi:hypothetical protein
MIWDGMGFFTTKTHKLKRMRNPDAKAKWYDKYTTGENYLFMVLYLIALVMVIVFEFSKYDTLLSTEVGLITDSGYEYDINLGAPLMHGVWLRFTQLAPKVRSY